MTCIKVGLIAVSVGLSGCGGEVRELVSGTFVLEDEEGELARQGIVDVAMELDAEQGYLVLADREGKLGEHVLVQEETTRFLCGPHTECVDVPVVPPLRLGLLELHDVTLSNAGGRDVWFQGEDETGSFLLAFDFVREPPFSLPRPSDELGQIPVDGYDCIESISELGFDEEAPLGFSARDVWGALEETFEAPIHWNNQIREGSLSLDVGPEIGEAELSIQIPNEDAAYSYVKSRPGENMDEEAAMRCRSRFEISSPRTGFQTSGGAIDIQYGVVVTAEQADRASISLPLMTGFFGELSINPTDPAAPVAIGRPVLHLDFSADGVVGTVTGKAQADYRDASTRTVVEYATIGEAE